MANTSEIQDFIERAQAGGASEQSVVGMLTARGWPEKQIYEALAAHYEKVTGLQIPRRAGTGTAAKDAFFYLLIFSTLATWTIELGALAFTLLDRWLPDNLFSTPNQGYDLYSVASSIASVLVAFPIYLLVSRVVLRDERAHPEKLSSPVRKWLTYMALVIAAGIFIGDLIKSERRTRSGCCAPIENECRTYTNSAAKSKVSGPTSTNCPSISTNCRILRWPTRSLAPPMTIGLGKAVGTNSVRHLWPPVRKTLPATRTHGPIRRDGIVLISMPRR
jgi:hypothetical protein